MPGQLRLRFEPDDEWSGFLSARAEASGFAGEGRAYFNNDEILSFAARLEECPLSAEPSLRRGPAARAGAVEIEPHLALACSPVNSRGHLAVRVQLARDAHHAVTLLIVTTYEPLGRFARELQCLVRGEREDAVLEDER